MKEGKETEGGLRVQKEELPQGIVESRLQWKQEKKGGCLQTNASFLLKPSMNCPNW